MKRIAILLAVMVVLAWIGSKLSSPSAPTPEPGQTSAKVTQAQAEPAPSAPEKPLSPAEKKAQQIKWFGAETIVAAQRAVRGALKDPDSAQFKDVRANYTEEFGVVACGRFNAKNELGGYTGFKRFVSSGKSVILEEQDNIADAWVAACL
ncbi:hypothetical protein [Pseudomonas sp.]|uniref:hypothetical protein n=1 Tax=Pseudomonas sp. TaxID=306 RepID=UPI00299E73D6|nr:hypothetical protein [Pseudomonas sp.]MDX1370141.1 hypothetical protein [Pseudomonas sp.]